MGEEVWASVGESVGWEALARDPSGACVTVLILAQHPP